MSSIAGDPSDGIKGVPHTGFKSLSKRFPILSEDDHIAVGEVVDLARKLSETKKRPTNSLQSNEVAGRIADFGDRLYPQRINSFITTPGLGTLLFGDKTALGYQSAFDRINVRRLFLTVEQALERAAQAQLFELNDELTRANFVNIVEPYLRDVQAKRGLYGFLVVCDRTNNTPDVIDNNEFRADIFLKPAKSINYVTLTFVATRTGVSFEEVAGRV